MDANAYLIEVSQQLSLAHTTEDVARITRSAARKLCGADGATFILREGDYCHYLDEDAIAPLWKGRRFPMETCISGWSMLTGGTAIIEDIYQDKRIPHEAYKPTFVKSLVMVPIRESDPIGAIGNYWSTNFNAPEECIRLLRSLANLVATALENARLVQDLERSLKARDEFLSIAAHELRTPLSSLKLQLQMLARGIEPGNMPSLTDLKQATGLSLRQVEKMASFVENLLDVSKVLMQNISLDFSQNDLSEVVREVSEKLAPMAHEMKCDVRLELENGLVGEWDRKRMQQIAANLLTNAFKYAPGTLVRIHTRRSSQFAILEVEDKGPGIRKENQVRIFERFERAIPATHISGLGLGLWLTKKFVEAHCGQINLQSEESQGTKFILQFPFKRK